MAIFHRGAWSQLWLTLSSNESLGVLDSDYLEDFDGIDRQVSLLHLASGTRYPVLMTESSQEAAPHEVFAGWVALDLLPDGQYQIQGLVRDLSGNYTVLGDYHSPPPGAPVAAMGFTLSSGSVVALSAGSVPGPALGVTVERSLATINAWRAPAAINAPATERVMTVVADDHEIGG